MGVETGEIKSGYVEIVTSRPRHEVCVTRSLIWDLFISRFDLDFREAALISVNLAALPQIKLFATKL